jgi:hypothetical protein
MTLLIGATELPPGTSEKNDAKNKALQRIGWAVIDIDKERYQMAELHLAKAVTALQNLKRMEEGNGKNSGD